MSSKQQTLREASTAIGDMRFILAASIVALHMEGKPYAAAKGRMNRLAALQRELEELAQEAANSATEIFAQSGITTNIIQEDSEQ